MALTMPRASQINFDLTNITDPLIRINSGETGSADKDSGIVIERGDDTNVAIIYDESADSFALINTDEIGTTAGNVTIASYADLTLKKVTQSEQQYTTSNMMKFNQYYLGDASGSYFSDGEYQNVLTIIPDGNSQNYQVRGTISAQNAGETHTVTFNAALRSNSLPDLSWSIQYTEQYNGSRYIDPQLWTKETSTAGFIFAFKTLGTIYGNVTVDIDVIPRSSSQKSNVTMNNTVSSEQAGVDSGYTANDMTKVFSIIADDLTVAGTLTANVTGNASGTAATVTGAAQTNITSLGTLTTLTVDNIIINGTNIGHTSDTDSIAIASDGVVNFTQTPTVASAAVKFAGKESIFIPAAAMYPSTTNGCAALAQVETTALRPDLKCLDFDASSDEFAQFAVSFPKSWNEGTVTFQPFWTVTGTNTGTVAWQLGGIAVSNDDSINTAFGTLVATTALAHSGTSNDLMVSAESGAVTIAGSPAADDQCFFQINRDVSADAQTGDARLLGIKLFFTTDAGNDA